MANCATCSAENQTELEAAGLDALMGRISWREAARRAGLSHHAGLKNHMESHYIESQLHDARDGFQALLDEAKRDLTEQFRMTADPSAKALYLVALQNLEHLRDTKPSQQNLVTALKTIQELTGMKAEQKLMLQFSHAFFKQLPAAKPEAIEAEHFEDAEVVAE